MIQVGSFVKYSGRVWEVDDIFVDVFVSQELAATIIDVDTEDIDLVPLSCLEEY